MKRMTGWDWFLVLLMVSTAAGMLLWYVDYRRDMARAMRESDYLIKTLRHMKAENDARAEALGLPPGR